MCQKSFISQFSFPKKKKKKRKMLSLMVILWTYWLFFIRELPSSVSVAHVLSAKVNLSPTECIYAGLVSLPATLSGCLTLAFRNVIMYDISLTSMFAFNVEVWFWLVQHSILSNTSTERLHCFYFGLISS